jgi:hypothetical protein
MNTEISKRLAQTSTTAPSEGVGLSRHIESVQNSQEKILNPYGNRGGK